MVRYPRCALPLAGTLLVALVLTSARPAHAASGCVDGNLKAIGKKEASLLKCQSKNAAKPHTGKLSACETKVKGKFTPACNSTCANCTTCENNADSCESMVSAAITDAATLKAASKLVKGELKCYTKAAAKSTAVDAVKCIPKAQSKFTGTPTQRNTVEIDCVDNQVTTDGGGSPPTGKVTAICGGGTTTTMLGGGLTTTTTAGTTTTLFANPVCCSMGSGTSAVCTWANGSCGGLGRQGAAGSVCGATGTCKTPPPAPGPCCTAADVFGGDCVSGPAVVGAGACPGTFSASAVCPSSGGPCM